MKNIQRNRYRTQYFHKNSRSSYDESSKTPEGGTEGLSAIATTLYPLTHFNIG